MEKGNWYQIKIFLIKELEEIFKGIDYKKLNNYEKRKIIFEYLCNNLSYDYEMLDNIRAFQETGEKVSRNSFLELSKVINTKTGICNAISQYYKLLLEEVGIAAYCVICSDGTQIKHQLNLVYDDSHGIYSFDDITSVIVGRGSINEYFDYNLEFANFVKQGNVKIWKDKKWVFLPEDYISYLVGRRESVFPSLEHLPVNIVSVKSQNTLHELNTKI